MGLIAGRASLYVDGKKKFVGDSYSYTTDDTTVADSIGKGGLAGYTEDAVAPKINIELVETTESDLDELNAIRNATIVLDLQTGKQYTYTGAYRSGDPVEKNESGRATIEFHATACRRTK